MHPNILLELPDFDRSRMADLPDDIDILGATDSSLRILATPDRLAELMVKGFRPTVVRQDYRSWVSDRLQEYRSYPEVCSIMLSASRQHPEICRVDTIGLSVENRPILGLRITDNPGAEEPEPEFRVIGAHHGDEKIATEVSLDFILFLVSSYDTSLVVRGLVDSREIWVIPVINVDGHVQDRRRNANGVDINRDYGYKWYGSGSSTGPFSQPESRAVRSHSIANNITAEFAFHSVASYVNYLWDNHPADPPDSGLVIAFAERYADSTAGSRTTELAPVNGFDWYPVYGSCQDAGFGLWGSLCYTVETRQPRNRPAIDSIGCANTRAMLGMLEAINTGIFGQVQDSATGEPVPARISFSDPRRWHVYTDPLLGDFHKPLEPGQYTVTASADGYLPATVANVVVSPGTTTELDFELVPDPSTDRAIDQVGWLVHADPDRLIPDRSTDCLGPPDGRAFSLGIRGDVCLFSGPTPIRDFDGFDITVHDIDTIADGFWLHAADDWNGPWTAVGRGQGTALFDLRPAGIDSTHFLRIVCDSSGSSSDPRAGLDLDAVTFNTAHPGTREPHRPESGSAQAFRVWPVPAAGAVNLRAEPGSTVKIIDTAGQLVECCRPEVTDIRLDPEATGMRPGVYLVVQETERGRSTRKLVVTGR
ncbi:MAG: carboxypeptidase regulatory-like domain-containing protein [candidate division WOR-3 bacterium]|nr:MAG: carboxypeptidase regulatory-like domain-containing protein [candidate division WOR-3 bacterium]